MLAGYGRTATGGGATAARSDDGRIGAAIDAHERFLRGQAGGMRAILRFLQLPAADLNGRTLTDADFSGCNLSGARMEQVMAERASFYCADLRGVSLRDANLNRADLRGSSLKSADLAGCQMDEADLREAVLAQHDHSGSFRLVPRSEPVRTEDGGYSYAVDFSDASMKGARLGGAKLKNANFRGAILHNADFRGARLDGADFEGAVLTGVQLQHLGIHPNVLRTCVVDPTEGAFAQLPSIRITLELSERWTASNGALGGPAKLDNADLRPLAGELSGAKLTAASMAGVQAFGVDFSNAHLQGANLSGADLRDVDFTGADLRGARLTGARLRGAKFRNADLRSLLLGSGTLRPVDLTGANYNPSALVEAIRA